jgi:proteasome alpha subunit
MKPLEVEVIVAEVGDSRFPDHGENALYRVKFDGFISAHQDFCVIGGNVDDVQSVLEEGYREGMPAGEAAKLGRKALEAATNGGSNLGVSDLEVCLLEREREGRKFVRLPDDRVQSTLDG